MKEPAEITPLLERAHTDLSRLARKLTAREERRGRDKRGSRAIRVSLSALGAKEAILPSMAIPDLHTWGLDNDEIADVLAISRSTVDREWRFASSWIEARL